MNFEPQLVGKEPSVGIKKRSPAEELSLGRSLDEFRSLMRSTARENPWELLPQTFFELLKTTRPARIGIFFPKSEWAEPMNLVHLCANVIKENPGKFEILGPRINIQGEDRRLSFHSLQNSKQVLGPHNTHQLDDSQPEVIPDLLIVPALACDHLGQRLGRGGGYYDRYLSTHPTLTACAVLHSLCFYDELPARYFHEKDAPVHYVLTEQKFIKTRNEVQL